MSPVLPLNNIFNVSLGDPGGGRNPVEGAASNASAIPSFCFDRPAVHGNYFSRGLFRNLGVCVFIADLLGPVHLFVRHVFNLSAPTKVLGPVVSRVIVQVPHNVLRRWARAMERFANEPVHVAGFLTPFRSTARQRDRRIDACGVWSEDLPVRIPDPAEAAYFPNQHSNGVPLFNFVAHANSYKCQKRLYYKGFMAFQQAGERYGAA